MFRSRHGLHMPSWSLLEPPDPSVSVLVSLFPSPMWFAYWSPSVSRSSFDFCDASPLIDS
jgi:hypothetical protein